MNTKKYDVVVSTVFRKADGTLFADLGTFRWPNVSEYMKDWLAGSCKATAFWLLDLDEYPGGYTLEYRTLVIQENKVYSDTGLITFPNMSYVDVIRFEKWALQELSAMIDLFEKEHKKENLTPRRRNKILTVWTWIKQKYFT